MLRRILLAPIRWYRRELSPMKRTSTCRSLPTCSEYGHEAIGRYGLWGGGWMTLARMVRCHPLGTSGLDFVPKQRPKGAHWYLPWRYGRWRGTRSEP